jgi:hypothetical protein
MISKSTSCLLFSEKSYSLAVYICLYKRQAASKRLPLFSLASERDGNHRSHHFLTWVWLQPGPHIENVIKLLALKKKSYQLFSILIPK